MHGRWRLRRDPGRRKTPAPRPPPQGLCTCGSSQSRLRSDRVQQTQRVPRAGSEDESPRCACSSEPQPVPGSGARQRAGALYDIMYRIDHQAVVGFDERQVWTVCTFCRFQVAETSSDYSRDGKRVPTVLVELQDGPCRRKFQRGAIDLLVIVEEEKTGPSSGFRSSSKRAVNQSSERSWASSTTRASNLSSSLRSDAGIGQNVCRTTGEPLVVGL